MRAGWNRVCVRFGLVALLAVPAFHCGAARAQSTGQYFAVPLNDAPNTAAPKQVDRFGVPFMATTFAVPKEGTRVELSGVATHIYLLGMTTNAYVGAWRDPRDQSVRFWVGDDLGQIRVEYADGSVDTYPLILGESVWWGKLFYQYQEPFPHSPELRNALTAALRVYPAAPVEDGNYVAVIKTRPVALRSISFQNQPSKNATLALAGITVERVDAGPSANDTALPAGASSAEFKQFVQAKPLRVAGQGDEEQHKLLAALSDALYSNNAHFPGTVTQMTPPGYAGPSVSFSGTPTAEVMANAFRANVQDILDKIDPDGMYHTSTKGAISWGGGGFGTYRDDVGIYYRDSWSRDMGRSLQEITELGYLGQAGHSADYALRMAQQWADNPKLTYHGQTLPPHWSRVINRPDPTLPFENDGHGLISMFLYKLWQRMPDRDAWLRKNWTDVKAAGDWIEWQFDHPDISGSKDGVLYTTGESAGGKGYSVYADSLCMTALEGLADMAQSVGDQASAVRWRDRAAQMRKAIYARYAIDDPKYGKVWTLEYAGWPNKSTVLGPLITLADYSGFAPQDDDPLWRPANAAAYRRIMDTYTPYGFFGQAMGYGQGFVSESALLLDQMHDATKIMDWTARQIWDPRFNTYIVPEGVQVDPTGRYWYRAGDLGNGVQEAEIVKTLRIVIGVDDTRPDRVRIMPRLPYGWNHVEVAKYPVLFQHGGAPQTALLHLAVERSGERMEMKVGADKEVGSVAVRLGPFEAKPRASSIRINGKAPANAAVEQSGDSWWVRCTAVVPADHN